MENYPLNQWNHEVSVGLTGAFLCSKIFGQEMAKLGKGVILNISSDLGVDLGVDLVVDRELIGSWGKPYCRIMLFTVKCSIPQ